MIPRIGKRRDGPNGCENPFNQPIATNSKMRPLAGGLSSDVACRVAISGRSL